MLLANRKLRTLIAVKRSKHARTLAKMIKHNALQVANELSDGLGRCDQHRDQNGLSGPYTGSRAQLLQINAMASTLSCFRALFVPIVLTTYILQHILEPALNPAAGKFLQGSPLCVLR